jgi:serine palmitoyltransferase
MTVRPPKTRPTRSIRRLLGFNKSSQSSDPAVVTSKDTEEEMVDDADLPETEVCSTSSGTPSHHSDPDYSDLDLDPYEDVRDKLEELCSRDKARFVHSYSDNVEKEHTKSHHSAEDHEILLPSFSAYTTYLGYAVLIVCGHIRDVIAKIFGGRYLRNRTAYKSDNLELYAPLLKSWENFYTRRLYHRIQDCFNRPIASSPGCTIDVLERVSDDGNKTMHMLGTLGDLDSDAQRGNYQKGQHFVQVSEGRVARRCLNLGSYNYLGFADDWNVTCKKDVLQSLQDLPVSTSSPRAEFGTTVLHREVEKLVARFLGKEDSLALNMGFNTNVTTIPALVGRGDLVISDELNHTSIVNGARASGSSIRIFKHNDTVHLEEILKEAIIMGRPRTRRPWNKILVIVEGIYSMEGEYCDLANVVKVCKKYGAYVYLDEAHSVGAMGPTGRGCAEYCGVDTKDIDIMMGTFTKSFGGMGGYIAGSKDTIAYLRRNCTGSANHNSLSPVVCQQVISSFKVSKHVRDNLTVMSF